MYGFQRIESRQTSNHAVLYIISNNNYASKRLYFLKQLKRAGFH